MTERERFEEWLATKPRKEAFYTMWDCWQAATKAERERCARVAEDFDYGWWDMDTLTTDIAAAIKETP